MEHPTESIKELIKLSLMICRHLVWELFDRKKKHRGLCQINGLNPQCLWVNCGVGGNRTLVHTSNRKVFYMFSFHLVFENVLTENRPYTP